MKVIRLLALFFAGFILLSCCSDDEKILPHLYIEFKYDYNTKSVDEFKSQVKNVDLYVFEKDSTFLFKQPMTQAELAEGVMKVDIPFGEYLFMAWAGLDEMYYEISDMVPGDKINEMTVKLKRAASLVVDHKIASLWYGEIIPVNYTGEEDLVKTINLIKNTNTMNIIFYSADGITELDKNDYFFELKEVNGYLNYENAFLNDDTLRYQPYYKEQSSPAGMIVRFSTMPLRIGQEMYFRVVEKNTNTNVLTISLGEFLSLLSGTSWNLQEYLEREDEYTIVFFLSESWHVVKIIINQWVVYMESEEIRY